MARHDSDNLVDHPVYRDLRNLQTRVTGALAAIQFELDHVEHDQQAVRALKRVRKFLEG